MTTLLTYLMLLLTGIVQPAQANEADPAPGKPAATLEKSTIDLGVIASGPRINGEIRVQNTGNAELLIGRVRSSCGLMIPSWPDEPVQPGREAVIHFRYDTRRLGPFERKVMIHTNGIQKTIVVTVTGEVVPATDEE